MGETAYRVRRATVDDLPELRSLWQSMNLPAPELERRVTEFQVAESGAREICGALALEINGRQGRLHGESFKDFAQADELRALLWERMRLVATNQGAARIWTEECAPFWKQNGFDAADEAALKKLPATWGGEPSRWLTTQLWDEDALEKSLKSELAQFKEAERQQLEKTLRQGRMLKFAATALAIILAIVVSVFAFRLLQNHFENLRR